MTRLPLFLCLLLLPLAARAADINAASCERDDVQAAINAAATGDRVLVPAGTCTWTIGVTVTGKNITLRGAGKTETLILIDGAPTAVNLGITSSRVSQFSFHLINGTRIIYVRSQGFRIDNNLLDNQSGSTKSAVQIEGSSTIPHPTGVIDNNEFFECRVLVLGNVGLLAHNIWAEPSPIGTANAVFIEDNFFTRGSGNAADANYGGKYVFRHNTVLERTYVEVHSVQGNHRATRSWEVYNNTFHAVSSLFTAISLRGGTGVAFNNIITGSYTNGILLDNVRSSSARSFPPGNCNGESAWDGNQDQGWPCRDQIGRGQDAALWTTENPFPSQASEPAYFWNNTLNGQPVAPRVTNCGNTILPGGSCTHIQLDRDYFNMPRPDYTPFTYPHPLRAEETVTPNPPTGLQGTVRP